MSHQVRSMAALVLAAVVVVVGSAVGWPWYVSVIASIALLLFAALEIYEWKAMNPKFIGLVASVSAIASVSRAAVQAVPSVQPATFFVILAGVAFGPTAGTAVGVFTALGSNVFLGEGTWTPWQMLAWGLVGFTAGLLGRVKVRRRLVWIVPFGVVWGYLFGWMMNTSVLLGGPAQSLKAYLALCAASVWFDTNHAIATGALLLVAGPVVLRVFERFRKRLEFTRTDGSALSNH